MIVGTLWEDLPEEKKEIFRAEARRLKEEHMVRVFLHLSGSDRLDR